VRKNAINCWVGSLESLFHERYVGLALFFKRFKRTRKAKENLPESGQLWLGEIHLSPKGRATGKEGVGGNGGGGKKKKRNVGKSGRGERGKSGKFTIPKKSGLLEVPRKKIFFHLKVGMRGKRRKGGEGQGGGNREGRTVMVPLPSSTTWIFQHRTEKGFRSE